MDINKYIDECKQFWNVIDFKEEIFNWQFKIDPPKNNIFNIGHPIKSHKGSSVGDILPYTRLPELIKTKYPNSYVSVPEHFKFIFKNNPFIDNFKGSPSKWGSLGTWGTTVQRTCNVWGFKTFKFSPIVYSDKNKTQNTIIFSINSNTGGKLKEFKKLEDIIEELKVKNYCIQIGFGSEYLLKNVNEYILNLNVESLIDIIASCQTYIGIQNSLYHLAKSLNLKVIGILPDNINPELVILPFLTQINDLELEMLSSKEKERSRRWINFIANTQIDPFSSHHIGWLYPDVIHLTENYIGTHRCPTVSIKNIYLALDNKIYPFNNPIFWDFERYKDYWI